MSMVDIYRTDRFGNPLGRLGYVSEAIRERKTDGTDTLDITCRTMCDKGDRIIFATPDGLAHEYEITDITHDRRDSLILSAHATGSISELGVYVIEDRRNRSASPHSVPIPRVGGHTLERRHRAIRHHHPDRRSELLPHHRIAGRARHLRHVRA